MGTREMLSRLRARGLGEEATDAAAARAELEGRLGASLPPALVEVVDSFAGAIVFDASVTYRPIQSSPMDRPDGRQSLEVLYGSGRGDNSLLKMLQTYEGRMPAGVLPVGGGPGGDQICLALTGPRAGSVYYWNHDDEREITGEDSDFGNMYLIAVSLEDFLASLEVDEEAPSAGDVVRSEAWLKF